MALSSKEQKLLENLLKKKDEPERPEPGKNLNISIDLGDDKQVEKARRLGLLDWIMGDDDDDDDDDKKTDDDDDDSDDDDDDVPRRRGYFKTD